MRTLDYLADSEYRGIAWRLVRSTVSGHGMQDEVDIYEVWARGPDGKPRAFTLTAASSGLKPLTYRTSDETILSEGDYADAVHAHGGVRDTAEWLAERERKRRRILEIDVQIASLIPRCPNCGGPMVVKTRKQDNQPFFSCEGFPSRCLGGAPASRGTVDRIDELRTERERLR